VYLIIGGAVIVLAGFYMIWRGADAQSAPKSTTSVSHSDPAKIEDATKPAPAGSLSEVPVLQKFEGIFNTPITNPEAVGGGQVFSDVHDSKIVGAKASASNLLPAHKKDDTGNSHETLTQDNATFSFQGETGSTFENICGGTVWMGSIVDSEINNVKSGECKPDEPIKPILKAGSDAKPD
jgi:hypothetical protein